MIFTPLIARQERPHGQGVFTYGEDNRLRGEVIFPHAAPDPIRQGDTPARPARQYIAIMQTNPHLWGSGLADLFGGGKVELHQQKSGQQMNIRAVNTVGGRVNIERPPAVTYGSLFQLGSQTYDLVEG